MFACLARSLDEKQDSKDIVTVYKRCNQGIQWPSKFSREEGWWEKLHGLVQLYTSNKPCSLQAAHTRTQTHTVRARVGWIARFSVFYCCVKDKRLASAFYCIANKPCSSPKFVDSSMHTPSVDNRDAILNHEKTPVFPYVSDGLKSLRCRSATHLITRVSSHVRKPSLNVYDYVFVSIILQFVRPCPAGCKQTFSLYFMCRLHLECVVRNYIYNSTPLSEMVIAH